MRSGTRAGWSSIVAAAVPTSLVGLHASRYGQWIVDDAGITFAYARSLATGAGPVLQPGAAPVEGFSDPSWVAVLVVGRWLHMFDTGTWFGAPDLVLFPKAMALTCCFGIFVCFYIVARSVSNRPTGITIAAGAITAAIPSFVIWTMSGLENALLALSVVALAAVLVRAARSDRLLTMNTAAACGGLVALAALTRPEGLIYAAAYPVAVLLLVRTSEPRQVVRPIVVCAAVVAIPLGTYLVWRLAVFGSWLPNTAAAKEQGLPVPSDLNKPTALASYVGWLGCILTVTLVVMSLQRRGEVRAALLMILVPLGLSLLAYAVLATDWMTQYRFATPAWPLIALASVLAFVEVHRASPARTRVVATTVVTMIAGLTLDGWRQQSDAFLATPTASVCYIARNTGYTFNTYADRLNIATGSLLAVDGGGTSLTSRLRFVDLSGLGNAETAGFWKRRDMRGLRDHVFNEVKPTFIRIWSGWDGVTRTQILEDPRLARDYVLVWGPVEGGGNYVRRDSVADQDALDDLQQRAPEMAAWVDAPYGPENIRYPGKLHWWCEPTLRPTAPGADPLPGLPR